MPNSTVLITGGAGFLGSHLATRALNEGLRVIVVDNYCTGSKSNAAYLQKLPHAPERLKIVEADVIKPWSEWLGQVEAGWLDTLERVFHFASPASPPHYQRLGLETLWVNSVGLKHALELADTHRARVIFSSTSEIYGDPEVSPQPETYRGNVNTLGVRACYDEAKRFGEALLTTHNRLRHTRHGLVRIFNTYGPRMNPADGRVVINLLTQAEEGQPLTIYGDGKQTRSFCYVDDLIEGIWRFSQLEDEGPVNLGNDTEFTILELAEKVRELFPERKLDVRFEPLPSDDPMRRRPDLSKAKSLLSGWTPKVSLKDGLRAMLEWLRTLEV